MSVGRGKRLMECGPPSGIHGAGWREAEDCPYWAIVYLWHTSSTSSGGWYVCSGHAIAVVAWLEEQHAGDSKLEIIREQA